MPFWVLRRTSPMAPLTKDDVEWIGDLARLGQSHVDAAPIGPGEVQYAPVDDVATRDHVASVFSVRRSLMSQPRTSDLPTAVMAVVAMVTTGQAGLAYPARLWCGRIGSGTDESPRNVGDMFSPRIPPATHLAVDPSDYTKTPHSGGYCCGAVLRPGDARGPRQTAEGTVSVCVTRLGHNGSRLVGGVLQ